MMKTDIGIVGLCAFLALSAAAVTGGSLIGEIAAADRRADAAVAAIRTPEELKAKQAEWQAAWRTGIGGLPETKTPLNAKAGPAVTCDGFTLQNVLFESQPGVYVVGHLFLPDAAKFAPPYPCVMMPMGHSDNGILNLRYATHAAMTARAGLAVFSWDPIGQGERRQIGRRYDAQFSECAREHSSLGARGWLVGWNFARFRIWDAIRAVDYVLTRKEIDGKRLGVMGTSGGGTMSAYMQAWDERITVAFPNCFISSIRAVFGERGCHDAEQFFFGQLTSGVNHAAILALGQPRVALATGSRWRDYFPHHGAVETFAIFSNLVTRLQTSQTSQTFLPWHFSCDGPHGLPASTRAAQTDWMRYHLCGATRPRSLAAYRSLDPGPEKSDDPSNKAGYPFNTNDTFFTSTRQVRDLPGFRSVYALIAERALELKAKRTSKTRTELREIVRRRAGIRTLEDLTGAGGGGRPPLPVFDHPRFGWWYLRGPWGCKRENEAGMLATLGRSVVGRDAERIVIQSAADAAANGGKQVVLKAKGWDCIAAAHAYAAEPQLFSGIEFTERPPSWTEMIANPDTKDDSFAIGVWGALVDYDWVDLVE